MVFGEGEEEEEEEEEEGSELGGRRSLRTTGGLEAPCPASLPSTQDRAGQRRAGQRRAEQSNAEESRAEYSRAEQGCTVSVPHMIPGLRDTASVPHIISGMA
eukprot:1854041-Rhodomonas_salina.1